MKRLAVYAVAAALLAGVSFRTFVDYTASITYLAKTDGIAIGKAKYAPQAPAEAQRVAAGICSGAMEVAWFDPEMGITQSDVDAYAERYNEQGKTCDEVHYLGTIRNADGSTDEIFALTIAQRQLWYVITIADGLATNIQ